MLEFLARGARKSTGQKSPGQDLDAARLLTIEESEGGLENAAVSVRYDDRYDGIRKPALDRAREVRNAKTFDMLYFQMMVQPVNAAVPAITITK